VILIVSAKMKGLIRIPLREMQRGVSTYFKGIAHIWDQEGRGIDAIIFWSRLAVLIKRTLRINGSIDLFGHLLGDVI
jgi:hypothetical protein